MHTHKHNHESCGHHGHHYHHGAPSSGRVFAISLTLNGLYALLEILFGIRGHSLALVADAIHNLGDMLALAAAWGAVFLSRWPPTARYTYGYGSSSILTALANTVFLLLITGGIAWQSLVRLIAAPEQAAGMTILVVAGIGVVINGGTAMMFFADRKKDLNKRAAFQHLLADASITVGVVIAGLLTIMTGWHWLDPVAGLLISITIVLGTWSLLRDATRLAMGAVPEAIDRAAVAAWLASLPGVSGVHDLHIWGLSTTETALTTHLIRPGKGGDDAFLDHVTEELGHKFGIGHATLQIESGDAQHPCRVNCTPAHDGGASA